MIRSEWRRQVEGPDREVLDEILREAAAYDEEAGFPATSSRDVDRATWHLLVWLLPDLRAGHSPDDPPIIAAHLGLHVDPDGVAEARYVVRPSMRSRGITTLLVEQRGIDLAAEGGWDGTGARAIRVWARGDHPAAQRLMRRFRQLGIARGHRQYQLLAPLRGGSDDLVDAAVVRPPQADERDASAKLWQDVAGRTGDEQGYELLVAVEGERVAGAVWVDPAAAESTEHGPAGRIVGVILRPGAPDRLRSRLLLAAMSLLRERGLRVGAITVDADDEPLVRYCRLLDFAHDRTDTEYFV